MSSLPPLDEKALSNLLTPLASLAAKALEGRADDRDQYEQSLAGVLSQLEKERELVRELKEHVAEWEERGKREGLVAQRREGEVSQAVGRVEGLERELREVKEKCNELLEERARLSGQLSEKKEEVQTLEQELLVLREKVGALMKWKVGAEGRLRDRDSEALTLIRKGKEEKLLGELAGEREKFLESERLRLAKLLAQLETKASTLEIEKATEGDSMRRALREAKEKASEADKRADKVTLEVEELERLIAELQADRAQAKEDHAREVEALTNNIDLYKEAAQDAEARFKEMKILMTAIEEENKESKSPNYGGRPRRKRRLADRRGQIREQHVDNMLQLLQEDLDRRADELEQQREEYEQVVKAHSKLKVAVRAAARERDIARAEATAAESRAEISEKKVIELTRRNAELERRIVLTGELAERDNMTPQGNGAYYGGDGGASKELRTPGRSISRKGMSLNDAAEELSGIRRREDDIIASIAAQRDLYRSMMLSSEKRRSQTFPN